MASEFDVINQYFKGIGSQRNDVDLGIGDDCALLNVGDDRQIAMTTDTLIEGVHFFPDADPLLLGHKSLAVSLSDLAAMGADPSWFSLAISLPESNAKWLDLFTQGMGQLAQKYNVSLVGGDTTKGSLTITVQAFGWVKQGHALLRSGAKNGDIVCLSGPIGRAALAIDLIYQNKLDEHEHLELVKALHQPEPQLKISKALIGVATSAIDISDGLLADLGHICSRSQVGCEIRLESIPTNQQVSKASTEHNQWKYLLSGGDDYQLCFTIPENKLHQIQSKFKIYTIGHITPDQTINVLNHGDVLKLNSTTGFDHFA